MASVVSNQRNIDASLWNLARSRWIHSIHQEIGQLGSDGKESHVRKSDGVSLSDNAVNCLEGRECKQQDHTFLKRRPARHFNAQIAPDRSNDKSHVPFPKDSGYMYRKAFLSRNYPFGETGITPRFTDHTKDLQSLVPSKQYIKPDPDGGAYKNPVVDGIVDTLGTMAEMLVYGLKDAGRALLGFVR